MSRQTSVMKRLSMTVVRPSRRTEAGYVARWTDPLSGRRRQKQLGQCRKRDAYDSARELAEQIDSGMEVDGLPWLEFCRRYEQQALGSRSPGTVANWRTVQWFVEEHCPLRTIRDANTRWIDLVVDAIQRERPDASTNTVASYLTKLRAALRWAARKRYLDTVPWFDIDREERARSRAVTPHEFSRMIVAVPLVRRRDAVLWRRLLRGQFYTGLRIGELLALSWDADADIHVIQGRHPLIEFRKQKNRKRQTIPIAPEAWEVLCDTALRSGSVFGIRMTPKRVVRVIGRIGKAAGVITNKETGKFATSHDVRRAFYDWCHGRFGEAIASMMLRHADQETTLIYYNTQEAERAAELLWKEH